MSVLWDLVWPLAVLFALLGSGATLVWLSTDRWSITERLQERFILGIPWGSALVIAFVLAVYLFVQDGFSHWDAPVFLPFINWSYLYPLGVVLAPFTHAGPAHLVSNLVTAAVLGPLVEYIWGHYPERRGRRIDRSWVELPAVRALVIFPGAVVVVAIVSSLFAWGPVIGFSGVVFAFAGFTVVRYPLGTIVALMGRGAFRQLGRAITDPVVVAEVTPTISRPPWVGVSVQGHVLGFLIGAILAILLLYSRPSIGRPDPLRVWVGTAIVALGLGMWAIWQSGGSDVFILYQALGVILVLGLVLLITVATVASDRPLWGRFTRRQAAVLTLALPILVVSLIAIPLNVLEVDQHDPPPETLSIEDYDVYYAEHEDRQLLPALPIPGMENATGGTSSGVIVVSESRQIWTEAASQSDLKFDREANLSLGGVGWRADVSVTRDGWDVIGNESVYHITLHSETETIPAFASAEQTAEPTIANYTVALGAELDGFYLNVTTPDGETERSAMPASNESITVGELTVEHTDDRLLARHGGTRVPIAELEDPEIDVED